MFRRHLPILVVLSAVLSGAASWLVSESVDETADLRILRVVISPSGRWIAAGAASGWIGIIDQTKPDSPQRFRGGPGQLRDLRFSKDEQWLIVHNDQLARHAVQSMGTLEPLGPGDDPGVQQKELEWPGDHSSNVVRGEAVAVFGNASGSIEVHELHSGKMLRRFTFR